MAPLEEGGGMSFGGNQVVGLPPEKSQTVLGPVRAREGRDLMRGDKCK